MTRRLLNRLTALEVQHLSKPGKYADGGGLNLIIGTRGQKRWAYIYTRHGRRFELGLGAVRDVPLAAARTQATEYREALAVDKDPRSVRQAAERRTTFGDYAAAYLETMTPTWRNPKHAQQWVMTVTVYAAPLHKKLIHEIVTDDVVRVLKPRWLETPETADRLRGRIEKILDSAKAMGLRDGDNPARWRGHLDQILPKRRSRGRGHHTALPFEQLPDFLQKLGERSGDAARALEFTILTAARTREVIGARWEEFDLDEGLWTVPGERMKAAKDHRVPLSAPAIALLKRIGRKTGSAFVFTQGPKKKPLSNMAMAMILRRMDVLVTVHGFRSSFRDWAAETTNFSNEVCEMALAHAIPGKSEAAYRRGDLFLKRRRLMEQWGRFCAGTPETSVAAGPEVLPQGLYPTEEERTSLLALLSHARCALCGSGWGDPCRSPDDAALPWGQSHDRRFMRLVEDWSLTSDGDLATTLASAKVSSQASKAATVKLEIVRRALSPAAWLDYLASAV
ncbi:tyrosine-type recombinase/integrase [Sphingomonas oryzagri]|uniref:Tyrosine-type recombinase/integrase n=1 Tax=Sphingomonas oryzagri TaxID=3042314 RepID=A0ABT6N284_9SPHN|nr:site-specific integrase [Sphingomonas oryzagri]MDH7639398.1 tyrosine-type recombinase/integrase [Sphingomonas oryzagri]